MSVSKVVYNGGTLIDLTQDSVSEDTLLEGITAHDASGAAIVGTLPLSGLNFIISLNNGVADRTKEEIDKAYADGRLLVARQNGKQYFLQYATDSGYCFLNASRTNDAIDIEFLCYNGEWSVKALDKATESDMTTIVENAFE